LPAAGVPHRQQAVHGAAGGPAVRRSRRHRLGRVVRHVGSLARADLSVLPLRPALSDPRHRDDGTEMNMRVALVGAGSFGQQHLRAYSLLDGVEVAWICDRDPEAAVRAAASFGVPRATADLADVLEDPDVDLVDVVTPVASHAPQAIEALAAGKSVLCEKPMALNLDQAREMVAAEAASEGQLHVKYHQRFDPVHERVRDAIADGVYGEALTAHFSLLGDHMQALRSRSHWRGDPAVTGGGCLFESGSHLVDLA